MTTFANSYEGFQYDASELSAFSQSFDSFIISLKDGSVVHFVAVEPLEFSAWLKHHKVRDVKSDIEKVRL